MHTLTQSPVFMCTLQLLAAELYFFVRARMAGYEHISRRDGFRACVVWLDQTVIPPCAQYTS